MKKVLVVLFGLLVSASFANEVMQKNMIDMENALTKMQKGYLYNSLQMVNEGMDDLLKANKQFRDTQMKSFLPDNKKHMYNIAVNSADRIDGAVANMKKYLAKKEYLRAHQSYGEIIYGCTSCHGIVRSW